MPRGAFCNFFTGTQESFVHMLSSCGTDTPKRNKQCKPYKQKAREHQDHRCDSGCSTHQFHNSFDPKIKQIGGHHSLKDQLGTVGFRCLPALCFLPVLFLLRFIVPVHHAPPKFKPFQFLFKLYRFNYLDSLPRFQAPNNTSRIRRLAAIPSRRRRIAWTSSSSMRVTRSHRMSSQRRASVTASTASSR